MAIGYASNLELKSQQSRNNAMIDRRWMISWMVQNLGLICALVYCSRCFLYACASMTTMNGDDQHQHENNNYNQLTVKMYKVMPTSAVVGWCVDGECGRSSKTTTIAACELVFGPSDVPDEVQVLPIKVLPVATDDRQQIELFNLQRNVTYHLHMVCDGRLQTNKLISNTIIFITGGNLFTSSDGFNYVPVDEQSQLDNWTSSTNIRSLAINNSTDQQLRTFSHFPEMTDSLQQPRPLPDVILGAIFGCVGFLIITITVVIIVRRYSRWQMRHHRMYDIQEDFNNRIDAFPDA